MKSVLITGAAKRIGRTLAHKLAASDYFVWIHYHHSDVEAAELCQEIRLRGGHAEMLQADLCYQNDIDGMFEKISDYGSGLDALINNASLFLHKSIDSTDFEEWNAVFGVNLRAAWYCSIRAAEMMNDNGSIVNIMDANAEKAWRFSSAYSISKRSLGYLTDVLAKSLAPKIRVNAIALGLILRDDETSEKKWTELLSHYQDGRSLSAESVAERVFRLLGDPVSGQILHFSGE